jgi:hypothetical protein
MESDEICRAVAGASAPDDIVVGICESCATAFPQEEQKRLFAEIAAEQEGH